MLRIAPYLCQILAGADDVSVTWPQLVVRPLTREDWNLCNHIGTNGDHNGPLIGKFTSDIVCLLSLSQVITTVCNCQENYIWLNLLSHVKYFLHKMTCKRYGRCWIIRSVLNVVEQAIALASEYFYAGEPMAVELKVTKEVRRTIGVGTLLT